MGRPPPALTLLRGFGRVAFGERRVSLDGSGDNPRVGSSRGLFGREPGGGLAEPREAVEFSTRAGLTEPQRDSNAVDNVLARDGVSVGAKVPKPTGRRLPGGARGRYVLDNQLRTAVDLRGSRM